MKRVWVSLAVIAVIVFLAGLAFAYNNQPVTCKLQAPDGYAVNLYASPDQTNQIGMIFNGDTVTLLESQGAWRRVKTNEDATGWIYAEKFCR